MKLKYKINVVFFHKKKSSHQDWRSQLFLPPALLIAWFFLNLRVSANKVTIMSIFFPILGSFFLTSQDLKIIFLGSFGILIYFVLDYSDGAIAKISKTNSPNGLFLDLLMHPIAVVSTVAGISIGAVISAGPKLIPFAILTIIATLIANIKYAYIWFAVAFCTFKKKNISIYSLKKMNEKIINNKSNKNLKNYIYSLLNNFCTLVFHENYLIFTLPFISLVYLFFNFSVDFRLVIVIIGAILYLPISIISIIKIIKNNKIYYNYLKSKNRRRSLVEQSIFE
jgi:phosphatidylglycerophosphate synthase